MASGLANLYAMPVSALWRLGAERGPTRMKWKPYPVYKASGLDWLGDIPVHWEVNRAEICRAARP